MRKVVGEGVERVRVRARGASQGVLLLLLGGMVEGREGGGAGRRG